MEKRGDWSGTDRQDPGSGSTRTEGGMFGPGSPTFLTSKVDALINWGRMNSLWPMPFGTACCAIEMMASAASNYDLARFGMERMSFSPRQADVLICAGRVRINWLPFFAGFGIRCLNRNGRYQWVPVLPLEVSSTCIRWCRGSTRLFRWTSTSRDVRRAPKD